MKKLDHNALIYLTKFIWSFFGILFMKYNKREEMIDVYNIVYF